VLTVSLPAAGGGASLAGIGLVLLATVLYGVAFNLAEPLENRNGALSVIWRAQLVALAIDTPAGVAGLAHSTPHLSGLAAMVGLGVLSTGAAFAAFTTLIARVGATRASVTIYLVPVVAVGLGASTSGEPIAPLSLAGIALVLLGAYLTGRRAVAATRSPEDQPVPRAASPGHPAPVAARPVGACCEQE
jgi:drug/metabolite transporter (DMT)-like permease